MDQTPRGYPYPECDPPLVQDASFISQLQALAEAVDADMTAIENEALDALIAPPMARMLESPSGAWATPLADITYSTSEFANPASMADTASGGIRIPTDGWYLLGTYCVVIIGTGVEINARTLFLRNGTVLTLAGDQARLVTATAEDPYLSATVLLSAGDLITTRIQHSGVAATGYTTTSRIWAMRLLEV